MKVVVIGSGIVGASAAYQLVKQGHDVIVIDKKQEGKATSAGAGIVCPWISRVEDEDWYTVAKNGAKFYTGLIEDLKEDGEHHVGYKKVGALRVDTNQEKLDDVEESLKIKQKNAPELGDIVRLTSDQAKVLFPPLDQDLEAVFVSGAARVDGRLLRDALKRAAQRHGAQLIEEEAALVFENEKVAGVSVKGEILKADKILIAAGAWTPELLRPLGLNLQVEPQRGQIAHITMPEENTSQWPVVLPDSSHYMLAFDDSRVVAGATRETGSGFDYRLTAGGVNEVISEALHVAPGLEAGTLEEVRIGFRPMGPDVLPILGPIDGEERVILATGLGASGLTMGPYVGHLAAAIVKGDKPDIDLTPYQPSRAIQKEEVF